MSYAIDGRLVTIRLEGTYEPQDIIRQFVAAMGDPGCPERVTLLLDVTRSESLSGRSPDEIRLVAEFLGPYAERIGGRCAVVATKDVHFGLGRMGERLHGRRRREGGDLSRRRIRNRVARSAGGVRPRSDV